MILFIILWALIGHVYLLIELKTLPRWKRPSLAFMAFAMATFWVFGPLLFLLQSYLQYQAENLNKAARDLGYLNDRLQQ